MSKSPTPGTAAYEHKRAYDAAYRQQNLEARRAKDLEYREKNKDRIKAQQAEYYIANAEKLKAKQNAYYASNREAAADYGRTRRELDAAYLSELRKANRTKNHSAIIAGQRKWALLNKEKKSASDRAYYASNRHDVLSRVSAYRLKNAEKISLRRSAVYLEKRDYFLEKSRQWAKSNPEARLAHGANRRARNRNSAGTHSPSDIASLMSLQKGRCAVCHCGIRIRRHVDHVIPLSRGGRNDKQNLQLLCPTCNMSKHAKDPISFMQSRGYLI